MAGVGLRSAWRSVESTGLAWAGEASLRRWSAPVDGDGRDLVWQAAAQPLVRWRADPAVGQGWFIEGGIGLSLHGHAYRAGSVRQGSRWNFQDVLALGYRPALWPGHEVSLRLAHFSNAGLRRPNPGEESLTLRWSVPW